MKIIVSVLGLVLLAGCSSAASGHGAPAASSSGASVVAPATTVAAVSSPAGFADAAAVAKAANCPDIETQPLQLFSKSVAWCQLAGGQVTVATFTTNKYRDEWINFAIKIIPGMAMVKGDKWAASSTEISQAALNGFKP